MNTPWIGGLLIAGLVVLAGSGCSKKEEASVPEPTPEVPAESTADVANPAEAAVVAEDVAQAIPLTDASSAITSGNYEAAAASVVRAQYSGTLTEEQRQEIQRINQQMLDASQRSAEARQAYQSMTRALNGR